MRFRAIHLRAILLPLGVAVASIAAVAWYGLVKIPAQQRYITDRNLRLLKTKSAQIKSKLDNFDLSIDHALEFFPKTKPTDVAYVAQFQEYVHQFAPGLQVVTDRTLEAEKTLFKRAGDPPRVLVERDEGRYFLFLGYNHDKEKTGNNEKIVAKADLEQILAPFLSTGTEFDALLVVSRDGRVILQRSSSGLELVHVDSLRDSSRPQPPPPPAGQRPEPVNLFESLRTSTSIANVTLGNSEYQMYVQPVQLSLNAGEGKNWPVSMSADEPPGGDIPEEWALCGFVRSDHFRAASSSISYTYLLWFGVALVTVCLATPLLKLHMLSPSERLQGSDAALVAVTTFLVTALITFCAIDAYHFYFTVNAAVDNRLKEVATSIREHFNQEAGVIAAQLERFRDEDAWHKLLSYKDGESLAKYRAGLKPVKSTVKSKRTLPTSLRSEGTGFECVDAPACRDHVLAKTLDKFDYPYFELIAFEDQAGWQRIKWSTHGVTPFINVADAQLPYFAQLKSARRLLEAGAKTAIGGVTVIQSPNSGEINTLLWQPLAPQQGLGNRPEEDLIGQTMFTDLVSVANPILPAHVQFAVVDKTGRVMFHSDPTHRLQENFFLECEDNAALRAAASGRRSLPLNAYYLGRSYRMYATPLELRVPSFADPVWTLVTFEDKAVAETLNLETLTAAAGLFGLYGSALAVAWVLLQGAGRGRRSKWFWPSEAAGRTYRDVALVNGSLTILFLGWIAHFESALLLAVTALLAVGGAVATFLLVSRRHPARTAAPWWRTAFYGARVSYLLIIAAVPAIACFQVAYDFEALALTWSSQAGVAEQLEARDKRIKAQADRETLCNDNTTKTSAANCDRAVSVINQRARPGRADFTWDVNTPDVEWMTAPVPPNAATATRLDAFLAWMHGAYDDIATQMAAVLPDSTVEATAEHRWQRWLETGTSTKVWLARTPSEQPSATLTSTVARAVPTAGLWLIMAGLTGVLYALVRVVVNPLYALNLSGPRGVGAADIAMDASSHVLLIGPPGAGKTLRLASEANIRVFDTRTQSFFERRAAATPVPVERRSDVYAPAGAGPAFAWAGPEPSNGTAVDAPQRIDWLDPPDLPADPAVLIGIDHLEYCLDNHDARMRMLRFLEELIYRHKRTVWIATAREPIGQMEELPDACPDAAEMNRWIRVLQPFREAHVGLTEDQRPVAAAKADETSSLAAPYYRAVWASCSKAQQLALQQLAEEGVVNPNNDAVVSQLMRSGLVRRTTTFSVMSDGFRHFVLKALSPGEITEREHADVTLPWASVTTAMLTVALGLGALLVLTSQQLVDASIGYVPALAPAVPTVMKLLTAARRDGKPGAVTA